MGASETKPVEDSVAKVDDDIAVGSDIEFQRKWWKFTNWIWIFFSLIILADVLGCFGRGWLANAEVKSDLGDIKYERIERYGTPSMLRIAFAASAVRNEKVELWVSDALVKVLGTQRVIPQPEASTLKAGGIQYNFASMGQESSVQFALEPTEPGVHDLVLRIADKAPVTLRIYVMP